MVLSLVLSRNWPVNQLDVKNVFLPGTLIETVYCAQLSGFVDSLFGVKQAPRAWYNKFALFLRSIGFVEAKIRYISLCSWA
jgi:hypothetical protein